MISFLFSGVKLCYFSYTWRACTQRIHLESGIAGHSCYRVKVVGRKHPPLLKNILQLF